MKRFFVLLFFIFISKSFSQTYSFVLSYSAQGSFCSSGAHGGYIKGDNVSIYDGVTYGSSYPSNFNNRAFTLKTNYTAFEFMLNDGCGSNCNDKQTYSLMNLIKPTELSPDYRQLSNALVLSTKTVLVTLLPAPIQGSLR